MDPSRPQPVIDAAKVGGLFSAAVVAVGGLVVVIRDGVTADKLLTLGSAVNVAVVALVSLVAYLLPLLQAHKAAATVTPLESPLDGGQPLVPVDVYGKHAAIEPMTVAEVRALEPQPVSDMATPDAPRPQPYPRTEAEPSQFYSTLKAHADELDTAPLTDTPPAPEPVPAAIPDHWAGWARNTLTLKGQSAATVQIAREIIATTAEA